MTATAGGGPRVPGAPDRAPDTPQAALAEIARTLAQLRSTKGKTLPVARSFITTPQLCEIPIDCQGYNAVSVRVTVNGRPGATLQVLGAPARDEELWQLLPDPNANQVGVDEHTIFDVQVGQPWVRVEVLGGDFSAGGGYFIEVTPFHSAAQISYDITAEVGTNLTRVSGVELLLGVAPAARSLPVIWPDNRQGPTVPANEALAVVLAGLSADNPVPTAPQALRRVNVTITRPNNSAAYIVGDVINDAGAPSQHFVDRVVRNNGGSGQIVGARIVTSQGGFTGALRLHVYDRAPTLGADNVAYSLQGGDVPHKVGFLDFPAAAGTGGYAETRAAPATLPFPFVTAGSSALWLELETRSAFTPAGGQTFRIELLVRPD